MERLESTSFPWLQPGVVRSTLAASFTCLKPHSLCEAFLLLFLPFAFFPPCCSRHYPSRSPSSCFPSLSQLLPAPPPRSPLLRRSALPAALQSGRPKNGHNGQSLIVTCSLASTVLLIPLANLRSGVLGPTCERVCIICMKSDAYDGFTDW